MEFRKGTYISQVYATTIEEACINWVAALDTKKVQHLTKKKNVK